MIESNADPIAVHLRRRHLGFNLRPQRRLYLAAAARELFELGGFHVGRNDDWLLGRLPKFRGRQMSGECGRLVKVSENGVELSAKRRGLPWMLLQRA